MLELFQKKNLIAFNPIGSEHDDIDVEVDGTKYVEHKIKFYESSSKSV